MQVADRELTLGNEYRVLIVQHEALDTSLYLEAKEWIVKSSRGGDSNTDGFPQVRLEEAAAFATEVAKVCSSFSPSSYIMDVAEVSGNGKFIVLEANNTWSANPYDIAAESYLVGLITAADYAKTESEYHFVPDPYQAARAERMRPLPLRLSR